MASPVVGAWHKVAFVTNMSIRIQEVTKVDQKCVAPPLAPLFQPMVCEPMASLVAVV
jgi:hypothetical protein